MLQAVATQRPELLLEMYNQCLVGDVFIPRWKRARLVLIEKPNGQAGADPSYRPLSHLYIQWERQARRWLNRGRESRDLSDKQYSFRKGRSTIGAIREVTDTVKTSGVLKGSSYRIRYGGRT